MTGEVPHRAERGSARHWWRRLRNRCIAGLTWSQWRPLVTVDDHVAPDWSNLTVVDPPDRRSWADPFPLRRGDGWFLFVEEKLPGRPGHIAVLELDDRLRWQRPRPILTQPFHLSYPFLVPYDGELFMIPEAGTSGRIDAYRCTRFPDEWTHHATLMAGVRASDPTLVEHGGRWWLFVAMAAPGAPVRVAGDGCDGGLGRQALFLFSADSPVATCWEPHPLNPVVSAVTRARPAGWIQSAGGELLRPAQDCSARYGYAVRTQRIERLDAEGYAETEVASMLPARGRARATHTLNQEGGLTAIDAKCRYLRGWPRRWARG